MITKNPDTLRCRDFFIIETPSVIAYGDATFPKGTAFGGGGGFISTAKAPPWGSWLCAAKTEGVAYSTASEMSLPSSRTSTTSIMGRMKRAPFFRAKCEPSRLPRILLMAQGMPMWNTTRPFIR